VERRVGLSNQPTVYAEIQYAVQADVLEVARVREGEDARGKEKENIS